MPQKKDGPNGSASLPRLEYSDTALTGLKWLGLVLMVLDHTNKYLLGESVAWMYGLGRLCMPLFAFVLGYNLARPGMLASGGYRRIAWRLGLFGLVATVPFVVLNKLLGGWWPLNMLFTLLVAVVAAWLFDKGRAGWWAAGLLVVVWGGALGEYWWPAVGLCLSVRAYRREPHVGWVAVFLLCLVALYLVNGNFWALGVVPVLFVFRRWSLVLPRAQWVFYGFYPLHLALILLYLVATGGVLQGLR